jgi:hypothetical protein
MRTAEFIIVAIVKNEVFCARASDLTAGEALTKNWAMLEHHPGNLWTLPKRTIPSSEVWKSSHGLDDFGGDSDQRWGGRDIKNWQGKVLGARSDQITTRILEVFSRENFQKKKKMAGEDPLDPLLEAFVFHLSLLLLAQAPPFQRYYCYVT